MASHNFLHDERRHSRDGGLAGAAGWGFLTRWFFTNATIGGILALLWLILRSGSKPSRFAYPCQQAALSAATLAFGVPGVSALLSGRRRLASARSRPAGLAVGAIGLVCVTGLWVYFAGVDAYEGPVLDPPADYLARVYHVTDCPQASIGDRFVGLDNLIALMGREGLRLYRSSTVSLTSGPEGIIAADDVVVIKINYQWSERGGTNTDLLRGLIYRLLDHPDTFAGEIAVCENAQFASTSGFDRPYNNAETHGQSPRDVQRSFYDVGYPVSLFDWTAVRGVSVDEYSTGDMASGYVVHAYDAALHGRISYPKFQTSLATYISLRNGIWDPDSNTYDLEHLKVINVPVLKSHGARYGATACMKNYMGVVTTSLSTNSHSAVAYGLMGAVTGEVRPADLNILDCIWINAVPGTGPWCTYDHATRRDQLVASVDPIAADIWAVKNILIEGFYDNGYSPPWPYPNADPDDPGSEFRIYLDNSMNYLLDAGYHVTNNPDQIDADTWNGAGDTDGDSDVDIIDFVEFSTCLSGPGEAVAAGCEAFDLDGDNDVDVKDYAGFADTFTGPGSF